MIRAATLEDVPTLVAMGELMHAEATRYAGLPFDAAKVETIARQLIEKDDGFLWVAAQDDRLVGFMAAVSGTPWMSSAPVVEELAFYVHPDVRGTNLAGRLLSALIGWAGHMGVRYVMVGTSTGVAENSALGLYQRFGFTQRAVLLERDMRGE